MNKDNKREKVVKDVKDDIEKENKIEIKKAEEVINFIKGLVPYIIIFVVVILIRTFLFTPIIVSGPSMQPTLDGGELMILNKTGDLERFDVVVVDIGSEDIIKRIIAMPGESVSCEDGVIFVNGRRQDEAYSQGITYDFDKIILDDDEYFVMGDNRQNSKDSRHIGSIKKDNIKGTTSFVLFPFNKLGNIE